MAKALFGHVGSVPDPRLVAEVRRLTRRVRELETELARSRAEAAGLRVALSGDLHVGDEILHMSVEEPALT